MSRNIVGEILGDPPYRHLAAIPDEYELRAEQIEQEIAAALAESAPPGPLATTREPRPRHRALPADAPVSTKPPAPGERRWLLPNRKFSPAYVTINPALDIFLSMGMRRLLSKGYEGQPLWVGVALEGEDTLVVERCTEREPYARRVARDGRLTGGSYYRYALEAAGWESGRYPVTFDSARRIATAQRCDRQPFDSER